MFYTCLCALRTQRTVLWYSIIHLGYYGDGLNAIIVFAVCFMPESNQPNYRYIMDNLFKWVFLWAPLTLWSQLFSSGANGICPPQVRHRHAGAPGGRELHDRLPERGHVPEEDADRGLAEEVLPADRQEVSWRLALTWRSDGWLTAGVTVPAQVKKEPEVSDNRPSLLVHPYPPGTHETLHKVRGHCNYPIKRCQDVSPDCDRLSSFHSSKFSQKIKYVYSLADLAELVPMEYVSIPECIKQWVFTSAHSAISPV